MQPGAVYTIFDYKTGKSIEDIKGSKVKVKGSDYKADFYEEQYWTTFVDPVELGYDNNDPFVYSNVKSVKYDFTVTYPKKNKDACVGICLYLISGNETTDGGYENKQYEINEKYWNGKKTLDKTSYYKNGKNSSAFVRL